MDEVIIEDVPLKKSNKIFIIIISIIVIINIAICIDTVFSENSNLSDIAAVNQSPIEWTKVGPISWSSCNIECSKLGSKCLEQGCSDFVSTYEKKTYSGGEQLMGIHYECSNSWGDILYTYCCCSKTENYCFDSDGGNESLIKGYVKDIHGIYNDFCKDKFTLGERICNEDKMIIESINCLGECKNGLCLKADDKCISDSDCNFKICVNGKCVIDKKEFIEDFKCIFHNSNNEQRCYPTDNSSRSGCSGKKFCNTSIKGYWGDQVNWASSCGALTHMIIDGESDDLEFHCTNLEKNTDFLKNKNFKTTYFKCNNGFKFKINESLCIPFKLLETDMNNFCMMNCSNNNDSCGIESISITNECDFNNESFSYCKDNEDKEICYENLTNIYNNIYPNCRFSYRKVDNLIYYSCHNLTEISEEVLVCKDSCPLENQCYDFGTRINDKYCSENGFFQNQVKNKKGCQNNYQCKSNLCNSGKCKSIDIFKDIIDWFSTIFNI